MGELIFKLGGSILVGGSFLIIHKFFHSFFWFINGGWEYLVALLLAYLFYSCGKNLFEWLLNIWNYS